MKIGPDTLILAHDTSTKDFLGYTRLGTVVINDNVFIGSKSIILPNVLVGEYSIIGAGSVVTKDIPDNCVAFGNPCKVVKKNWYFTKVFKKYAVNHSIKFKDENMKKYLLKQITEVNKEKLVYYSVSLLLFVFDHLHSKMAHRNHVMGKVGEFLWD